MTDDESVSEEVMIDGIESSLSESEVQGLAIIPPKPIEEQQHDLVAQAHTLDREEDFEHELELAAIQIAKLNETIEMLKMENADLKEETKTLKDTKTLFLLNKELKSKVDILQRRDQRARRSRGLLLQHALEIRQDELRDHKSTRAFQAIVAVLRDDAKAQDD